MNYCLYCENKACKYFLSSKIPNDEIILKIPACKVCYNKLFKSIGPRDVEIGGFYYKLVSKKTFDLMDVIE